MKKKLGLCIVYKNWNYGSILQSYATLLKLDELGVSHEIIRYERKKDILFYIKSLPRLLNRDLIYSKTRRLKRKVGMKKHPEFVINDRIRANKFKAFVKENFKSFSNVITSYENLCKNAQTYQGVLVGSDQLWLPAGLATNFFNLMFVPDDIVKMAYAVSFGVSEIPFYQKKRTKHYLDRINFISVREHSGQKIIRDLTNREVQVIVDPTLSITREVWDKYLPARRIIEADYIFCYFLGDNHYQREEAEKLRKETGLKIVTLRHMDEYIESDEKFGDLAPYDVGPAEFVNLIRHASFVCTDSFHGSVFSIIYHRQFISFNRYGSNSKNSRNSRLDSLFDQLGIERRFKSDIVSEIQEKIDYSRVESSLVNLRYAANVYLNDAIKEVED